MLKGYERYLMEAQEGMKRSAELINQLTDDRVRKVAESHFKKYLLQTVREWVTRKGSPEIGYWLNVCDGLNREFHVVSDADLLAKVESPTILFTVPAPFMDIDIPTRIPEGFSMADRFNLLPHVVNRQGFIADQGDMRQFFDMEEQIIENNAAKPQKEALATALTHLVGMYRYYDLPLEELLGVEGAAEIARHVGTMPTAVSTAPAQANTGISDEPDAYDF